MRRPCSSKILTSSSSLRQKTRKRPRAPDRRCRTTPWPGFPFLTKLRTAFPTPIPALTLSCPARARPSPRERKGRKRSDSKLRRRCPNTSVAGAAGRTPASAHRPRTGLSQRSRRPIGDLQSRHALEFPHIRRHQRRAAPARLRSDEDVVRADRLSPSLENGRELRRPRSRPRDRMRSPQRRPSRKASSAALAGCARGGRYWRQPNCNSNRTTADESQARVGELAPLRNDRRTSGRRPFRRAITTFVSRQITVDGQSNDASSSISSRIVFADFGKTPADQGVDPRPERFSVERRLLDRLQDHLVADLAHPRFLAGQAELLRQAHRLAAAVHEDFRRGRHFVHAPLPADEAPALRE